MAKTPFLHLFSIMHVPENPRGESCVPVSTADTPRPIPVVVSDLEESTSSVQNDRSDCTPCSVSRDGCRDGGMHGDQAQRKGVCGRPCNGRDGATSDDGDLRLAGYSSPVTRSPLDPWHSEQYLVGCLVKTHGWYWLRPRVLAGPWRRARVHSFMQPEGE